MSHCVYCGASGRHVANGALTCRRHSDLPGVDPDFYGWRMRCWWLERFTAAEIEAMASAITLSDLRVPSPRDHAVVGIGAAA